MVKIIDKIREREGDPQPFFSFEFFPPKTDAGLENLYLRIDRMASLQPVFVDVTWGASGSTRELSLAIAQYCQAYLGVEALLHLSCTGLRVEELKSLLSAARDAGIQNILALRGDPPKGAVSWKPIKGGLNNAIDLVKLIRQEHGDYFGIAVAGFPEGHPSENNNNNNNNNLEEEKEYGYLREKIDAGADFILTNFFYDSQIFFDYFMKCRKYNINCPIIPGMMPIQSFFSFQKMTEFCRIKVPQKILNSLNPIKDDDEEIKLYGIKLCVDLCMELIEMKNKFNGNNFDGSEENNFIEDLTTNNNNNDNNKVNNIKFDILGFHFFTLNLEFSVLKILKNLGLDQNVCVRKALPWRGSRNNLSNFKHNALHNSKDGVSNISSKDSSHNSLNTLERDSKDNSNPNNSLNNSNNGAKVKTISIEDVRPINWANRPKSYIQRTISWDEFPNGRWGDNRSPAFGELSQTHFFRQTEGIEDRLAMWGDAPLVYEDVYEIFAKYIEGKIPIIPWCESALQSETLGMLRPLAELNRRGVLSINSQPAVDAVKSDHDTFGWGGPGGRVYQKAYVEFFISPSNLKLLLKELAKYKSLSVYAVDSNGNGFENNNIFINFHPNKKRVTALTWGVFPNKEILQPTIFDPDTFIVWSKEAFELWTQSWAAIYDEMSESCELLYEIHDTFFLVAIIDNDFIDSCLFNALYNFVNVDMKN